MKMKLILLTGLCIVINNSLSAMRHGSGEDLVNACMFGDTEDALALIGVGVYVNAQDYMGLTPLHLTNNTEVARALIKAGADVHARTKNCDTPLHQAKNAEIALALIREGANVKAKNWLGQTALHNARDGAIAQILIRAGADANAQDDRGNTPLHHAKNAEIVLALIREGANISALSIDGTPLELAIEEQRFDVAKAIKDCIRARESMRSLLGAQHQRTGAHSPARELPQDVYKNIYSKIRP